MIVLPSRAGAGRARSAVALQRPLRYAPAASFTACASAAAFSLSERSSCCNATPGRQSQAASACVDAAAGRGVPSHGGFHLSGSEGSG